MFPDPATTYHLQRGTCDKEGCELPAAIISLFFTSGGPRQVSVCKTHCQSLGLLIDNLVQNSIFAPPA